MASAFRAVTGSWRLAVVALSVAFLLVLCRALGFGDGVVLGAAPASAVALAAAVVLRWRGALAAAAGFLLADLTWGLLLSAAVTDAAAHGLAALVGGVAMRTFARRRAVRSRTSDWLIFLAGTCVFTLAVAAVLFAAAIAGALPAFAEPRLAPLLALVFEPLGILTFGAVLASLREARRVAADLLPSLGIAALGAFLLGVLWLLLTLPVDRISPSGVTLLLSVPFCLWIAMQRRSLDGAAIAFVASHLALLMLLGHIGPVGGVEYVTTVLYLNLLVGTCQLVHAVNLDRLAALAEVEAQRRGLEDRVAARTARLAAMTEKALAADAAKMGFMATVSHEVRTPLSGVLGIASMLLAGRLDPKTREGVEIIRTSGFHLLDVINRILDFARLGQAPAEVEATEVDLAGVAREVLQEACYLPYARGLELELEAPPEIARYRRCYRHGLRQILTNLVGNAAKFTEEGSVTLRLAALPGELVRIEVEDTGPGVPSAMHEQIFLPFEQADGAAGRRHGGTGLGLAISAEVVRRMGGRIGLESRPGGSLFWVELPMPLVGAPEGAEALARGA